ncbi:MAG TPA: FAD-dependent oxidoreductase [Syntrophomonas sp.]|nr:FAD-dependent oxidoreductase [Syntrophomonas sp.]
MDKKYQPLFQPFKINEVEIKNKFFMAPMATPTNCDVHGVYTNDAMEYYVARAKGGVGLIITGANWVESDVEKHIDAFFPEPAKEPGLYKKMAYEITERVHSFGSKIFLQLTAGLGRSANPHFLKGECVAPSPASNRWFPEMQCRELTTEEVEHIVAKCAESAKIAQDSGFDGVEIHAVHEGYLLDCFTMKLFNQRTDKYGGDLRGRLTFPIEIVQAIKKECGQNFPVILRFSVKSYVKALLQGGLPGEDFKELGRDIDEALEAAKILEEAGYDAFDADAGTYDSWYWAHPPMYFKKGMYLPLAEQLKKVVTVPVMVAGRMDDPDMAVKALAEGTIDAVGLGRPLLTDPDYPNKIKSNQIESIRPCLGCHDGCFTRLLAQHARGSCTVNPECGRELMVGITPALQSKKVVVVGGGPAGMEAARVSALRRYQVTLFEAASKLGGALLMAGVPDFKEDDRALVKWYEHELKELKVDVRLGIKATRTNIAELQPDIVYTAEGSTPIDLKCRGTESDQVVNAGDVLAGKKEVGRKCVIVGGGLVGCELALHLTVKGHKIVIVEAQADILQTGIPMAPMNEWMLRDLLAYHHVPIITNAKLSAVTASGAVVSAQGTEQEIEADNIIVAIGFKSTCNLYEELKYDYPHIYNLGDSRQVRNIRAAIWDAYEVARSI